MFSLTTEIVVAVPISTMITGVLYLAAAPVAPVIKAGFEILSHALGIYRNKEGKF